MGNLSLYNSSFLNNTSSEGGVYYSCENTGIKVSIELCNFQQNSGYSSLISMENSMLYIFHSIFYNNSNNIFALTESTLILINVSISQHSCNTGELGCILTADQNSAIYINTCYFSNISSLGEGNIYLIDSRLSMIDSYIFAIFTRKSIGACISAISSNILLNNNDFMSFEYNCIFLTFSHLTVSNSRFESNFTTYAPNTYYGTIYCLSCLQVNISTNSFKNQQFIEQGGAILIDQNINKGNGEFYIEKCVFYNNSVISFGGAISSFNANLTISNNLFKQNKAEKGGAIYYDGNDVTYSQMRLKNNSFYKNSASLEGGAIKWAYIEPLFDLNNIYELNTALYGDNIAAFPLRIKVRVLTSNVGNEVSLDGNNGIPVINDIISGSQLGYDFSFEIMDIYNQTVTTVDSDK